MDTWLGGLVTEQLWRRKNGSAVEEAAGALVAGSQSAKEGDRRASRSSHVLENTDSSVLAEQEASYHGAVDTETGQREARCCC